MACYYPPRSWDSLLWLGAVIPGSMGLLGMLSFRHPKHLDTVQPIATLVTWRIVSCWTNIEALTNTIRRCQREMAKTPLFSYIIEVVTDTAEIKLLPPEKDIHHIIVPSSYKTPNQSLYKARTPLCLSSLTASRQCMDCPFG